MFSARRGATRPRPQVALIAILIGAIWVFGGTLPLGTPHSDPPTLAYQVRVVTFSLMLAAFAPAASMIVALARPSRWVLGAAAIVAIGGIVGGIGNLLEDLVRIANAEYLYGLGLFTLLIGMVGTTVVLLVRREVVPALLAGLSFAGFMSGAGHGPNIFPIVWFGFAAWILIRRPPSTVLPGSGQLEHRTGRS